MPCGLKTEVKEMLKRILKHQRVYLSLLIVICMGSILWGAIYYISSLRSRLMDQAINNVLTVTTQQQQAFDKFISGDRERVHSFAKYLMKTDSDDTESILHWLNTFNDVDAIYSVINLETGQFYNNKSSEIYQMDETVLEFYRRFSGSGVRDPYKGLYSDDIMFGYYECFSFADGVQALIQKSYDCSKVSQTFSLSFYNDQGLLMPWEY